MNSREAFEAYILRTTPTAELDKNNGEYVVQAIQCQWIGWNACQKELSEKESVSGWYSYDAFGKLIRVDPRAYPNAFQLIIRPTEQE